MNYHNTLDTLVYDQTAAEDYALYVQSFALAKLRLEEAIKNRLAAGADPKSLYITTDCDETILDNSAYNAWLLATGRDFHDDTWRAWCRDKQAIATPGAVEFMKFAASVGVTICYVTSRFEDTRQETADNLSTLGFPLTDSSSEPAKTQLFLAGMLIDGVKTKKKEQYAALVKRFSAAPLLQLGDNLSDQEPDRYGNKVRFDQRVVNAEADKVRWGADWIVFPNSVYGSWRNTLKKNVNGVDFPVTDEPTPVTAAITPVRPSVTPAEAPKIDLLRRWVPSTPIG